MSDFKIILVEHGQNIIDIALQEYGNIEAVRLVIDDNDLSFDSSLEPGRSLNIRKDLAYKPNSNESYQDVAVQKRYELDSRRINTGDVWAEEGREFSSDFDFSFS